MPKDNKGNKPKGLKKKKGNKSQNKQPDGSASYDVLIDQLTKRIKVIQGLLTDNINVGRDNKKSVDALNDRLREVETKLSGLGNSFEGPVPTSVSDEFSDDQLTKRLSVVEGLINDHVNVGRDTKKSVEVLYDHIGSVKTEMRIITCMLVLVLIILLGFVMVIVLNAFD